LQIAKIKEPTQAGKKRLCYTENLPEFQEILLPEISPEILKLMAHIKVLAIEYWDKFITDKLMIIYNHDARLDFLKLAMVFILNTDSSLVCGKTCEILSKFLADQTYGVFLLGDPRRAQNGKRLVLFCDL
jgi:hypothetical protein